MKIIQNKKEILSRNEISYRSHRQLIEMLEVLIKIFKTGSNDFYYSVDWEWSSVKNVANIKKCFTFYLRCGIF